MSAYMKFFTPSKKSVTDPNGGTINYPEICIDTNPLFEHKLTAHEIIILDQAAELERYETARQEDARRLEQVKGEREAMREALELAKSLIFQHHEAGYIARANENPSDNCEVCEKNGQLQKLFDAAALKDAK